MKRAKYSLSKRSIALLLSMVMVFAMLPAMHATAAMVQQGSQAVDNNTMDTWKAFFSPTDITTAHAGGVWTDKSVFMDNSTFTGMTVGNNNFLVALSAMGSNSVVVGQDYAPTDTMFVLDVSNSMSNSALSSMVTATNNAIRTLLSGEGNTNRVGVVLYGTTASVLLPLDHYTGVQISGVETYIQMNGNSIRAAQNSVWVPAEGSGSSGSSGNPWEDFWNGIFGGGNQGNGQYETTYLTNLAGNAVTTSVSTGGGTYIQGGMWKAWQQFSGAAAVSTDKASVKRAPVMVLMCDGAATYSASDFDNVPESATHGTGSASGTGDGFVTQLTAAFVKAKMAEKYGTDAFLYTLGLDVEDIAIAQAVLDPANKTAATDIDDAWTAFLQGSATVSMYRRSQGGSNQNVTITNDTATTLQSAFTNESYKYATKYFSASQVTDLNQQFQNIVNEISLSAGYYPTHLDDNGANYSGYITFVDELGKGMEVKEIEGIVIGDNTYTGKIFARALASGLFGTKQEPTPMGNEFVWAVKSRLGLTDNDEIWALLDYSYNTKNYLHYTSETDWSNYIVWYGDANGEYLGYDEELESIAAYRNACYGMLGTPDGTHQTTDMMYVGVQVSTNLSTGDQTVTFRVPAAMLPVVTYQINIDGNEVTENTTATLTYKAANPIRLVYEVGVKKEVTALNVKQYAEEIGGKFYLYTNKWDENPNLTNPNSNKLSYAYFEPGADNEHYYFTEDSVIYTDSNKSGTVASADALNVDGIYYYEHYVFNQPTRKADGTYAVKTDFHVEKLSRDALIEAKTKAVIIDGKLCVPEGTMHYAHSHNLYKGATDSSADHATANITETFDYARYQIVDATLNSQSSGTGAKYYELMYLGNNGRLEVQPATGISITKRVDDTITDVNATYTFDIAFTTVNVPDGTYNGVQVAGNKATVTLKAGETVYIYDLPAGTEYTITERYGDGYKQSASVGANGTVISNEIQAATFTNTKRGTGSLVIEKDVTDHPFTTSQIERVNFNFVVELTKADGTKYSGDVDVIKSGDTATTKLNFIDGKATFTLHDNQELTLINLPEGVKYTVYEVDGSGNAVAINGTPKSGYKLVSVSHSTTNAVATGEVAADKVSYAHFVNKYEAATISPEIDVAITKKVVGDGAPTNATFTFNIEQVTPVKGWSQTITTGTGTASATKRLEGLTFNAVGTYSFLIHEKTPTDVGEDVKIPGMTYDAKRASFTIVVTDDDFDGELEWSIENAVNATKTANNTVAVEFNNIYELNSVTATFHAKKVLHNTTGIEIPLTGFRFGLYSDVTCEHFAFDGSDPMNPRSLFTAGPGGLVDIKVHINQTMAASDDLVYYLKEIIPAENDRILGMTYDTTVYKVTITTALSGSNLQVTNIALESVPNTGTSVADGTTAVFNNTYALQPVTVTLSGEKTLDGRDWREGDTFTFELYDTDATFHVAENAVPLKSASAQHSSAAGSGSGSKAYQFEALTFDKVGIYHYVVKETNGGKTINGITYDATEYHVTVTVTPSTTEAMLETVVSVVKLGNGVVAQNKLNFNNMYNYTPVNVTLDGRKEIYNQTAADSNVSLPPISPAGYQFMLRKNNNAGEILETVTSGADGSFAFQPLHFTAPGEYVYEIVEVGAGNTKVNGVEYNAANWNVTVVVKDNGLGALVATLRTNRGSNVFTNTYKADNATMSLSGIKELVGAEGTNRPLQANDFSFTLMPVGSAPMPNGQSSVTVKNDASGKFTFPDIIFNAVGTYHYTITEEKETDGTDGIYYDKVVYTVTVGVTDNGTGKLVAKITAIIADKGREDETTKHIIDFYNSYYAAPVEVILSGNKVLENVTPGIAVSEQSIPLTGENVTKFPFSFKLEAVTEGAPMPAQTTVSSGANGAITFGVITFDAVGEYKYTVKEVIPANSTNGVLNGVTYAVQTHNITVVVTDNQVGGLVATVKLDGTEKATGSVSVDAQILSFRNTYSAAAEVVTLGGNKVLENVTPGITAGTTIDLAGNEFAFKLEAVTNGAPMPAGTGDVVKNAAGGGFRFGQIAFTALGEYKYTITEISDPAKGYITYAQPVSVTVKVTDANMDGKLETAVTYGNVNSLTITNQYKAEGTKLVISGSKKVDTRNPRDGEFSFTLTGVNGAPMSSSAVNNQVTVKNDASGKIAFPEIAYDTVGVYKYTIEEVKAADGTLGVTYDKAVYDVTVTVSDNGEGKLLAVAKSVKRGETANSDVVFFNKYQAAPVSIRFTGTKILTGRQLLDGEFSFILADENGTIMETVKNKDGKITFTDQKLLTAGTYKFFIQEDVTAKKDGIDYDETVYEVTVEVKDDGFGQLKAYIGGTEKKVVSFRFENTFIPKDAAVQITVEKELQNLCGIPMGLDGFKFQLEDAAGQKMVQTSDADGIAKFAFTFSAEDAGKTFIYKLTEVDTEVKGIQYSTAEYEVKIAVTKDAVTGELSTAVTITNGDEVHAGNPVFVNYYDLDTTPETGDETHLMEMGLCMGISGIGLLAVLILGRKKKEIAAE